MKICYISPLGSIHTYKSIKYFYDLWYEIHCIWNEKISNRIEWINYYSFDEKIKNNFFLKIYIFRIIFFTIYWIKKIKKINPDITHLQFIWFWSLIALFYKSRKLITTIWWSDILVIPKKIPLFKIIVNKILQKSDIIIMDWYNVKKEVLSYWNYESKIKMIWFWIDTNIFKKDITLKWNNARIKIISLRALKSIYNISTIIKAAKILKENNEDFEINIYWDWAEKDNLINMRDELWLKNYVIFKWKYNHNELSKYLNESDIYISVSLSDSWLAVSTGEAMSCWLPVIVTDNADNSKWIINYENWFVIPNKSPEKLAEKISYFINNKDNINKMWDKNISIISNKNNYYREMNKINNIYKELNKKS